MLLLHNCKTLEKWCTFKSFDGQDAGGISVSLHHRDSEQEKQNRHLFVTSHQYNRWNTESLRRVVYSPLKANLQLTLKPQACFLSVHVLSQRHPALHSPSKLFSIILSHSTMIWLYYEISVERFPSAARVSDFGDVEECLLDWFSQAVVWHPSEHRRGRLLPQRDFFTSLLHWLPLWWKS